MPKRKKVRARLQKGLDTNTRKKPVTRSESAPGRQFAGPFGLNMAGLNLLDAELAHVNELTQLQISQRRKSGRPTTADNFLEGSRSEWLSFFEGYWHEIGLSLLEIRENATSTIQEIQKLFAPLRGQPRGNLAECFLQGSPQPFEGKGVRASRKNAENLHREIQKLRSQLREVKLSCGYAENALKDAQADQKETIEAELNENRAALTELNENLPRLENERNNLEEKIRNQETHFFCSQLIEFLCKGKYAVKPLPLANSLAGLPEMGWRQSLARCSKMPRNSSYTQYPYSILQAISHIWKRKLRDSQIPAIEFFRVEIPKLPKKYREARGYLSEGWRDLRLAIEGCSKQGHSDNFMPYAITRAFVNYRSRPKTPAEQILDERAKLPS